MRRQPSLVQPSLEFLNVGLAGPVDLVSQSGEGGVGQVRSRQGHDGAGLSQVGHHVLGEPDIGLVIGGWLVGGGCGAAGRQDRDDNKASESSYPRSLAVACTQLAAAIDLPTSSDVGPSPAPLTRPTGPSLAPSVLEC